MILTQRLPVSLTPLDAALGSYGDWDFMLRMCDAGFEPRKLPGLGVWLDGKC